MMNLHDDQLGDISNVTFDTITGVSNMRTFTAKNICLTTMWKREQLIAHIMILRMLKMEGDIVDSALKEL